MWKAAINDKTIMDNSTLLNFKSQELVSYSMQKGMTISQH